MTTDFKIASSTLDLLDPDAKKDFLGAIGLLSSQSAFEAAVPDAELGLVEIMAHQIRQVSEMARHADAAARLASHTAQQARADMADAAQLLHRTLWQTEENMAETIRKLIEEKFGEQQSPNQTHVRRALQETVQAGKSASSLDEERLLVEVLLASLIPDGIQNGIGARLRRLVTSGSIGAPEIAALRRLATSKNDAEKIRISADNPIHEFFALADTSPALVNIAALQRENTFCYVRRMDQVQTYDPVLIVTMTRDGRMMLDLLDRVKKDLSPDR